MSDPDAYATTDAYAYRDRGCHTDCDANGHTPCYPDPNTCTRDSGSHPHRHGSSASGRLVHRSRGSGTSDERDSLGSPEGRG